jgi:hypothetical protein
MFIKTVRKPLKYTMITRLPGGEWLTGSTLTSWNKAKDYANKATKEGLDCTILVTRGGYFEYETRYYSEGKQ